MKGWERYSEISYQNKILAFQTVLAPVANGPAPPTNFEKEKRKNGKNES